MTHNRTTLIQKQITVLDDITQTMKNKTKATTADLPGFRLIGRHFQREQAIIVPLINMLQLKK